MTYSNIFKKSALALAAVGLFASASAQADSLVIEQDINSLAFTVNVSGTQDDVVAGVFNVDNLTTGTSFLAFCFELLQGVNVNALTPPGLVFTAGSTANADLQTLFNQSYSSLDFSDASQLAGFQIALWETLDNSDLSSGTLNNWTGAHTGSALPADQQAIADETEALDNAWLYLQKLTQNYPAPGNFALTTWSSPNSQDLIQASTATNRVPEPTTLMLGALGLAGLSAVRRRKS